MNLFGDVAVKPKRQREIYDNVVELSQPGASFYIMVALATVIAAFGLVVGSPAVVIGAMLVAPLMGPIFGIALGLTSGNRRLLWRASKYEVYGVALAVALGVVIGFISHGMPIDEEWLSRTRPSIFDLAIALASGLAGAYALIDERVSPSLPGVAIAVAVLPPLAACGLSISILEWEMAAGAMMLFIANFFAIQIAAAIVFSLFGMLRGGRTRYDDEEKASPRHFLQRFWVSFAVLGVIAWFMMTTLAGILSDQRLRNEIDYSLSRAVGTTTGARLSDFDLEVENETLRVTARVLTPRAFDPEDVADIEAELAQHLGRDIRLVLRSMISHDVDAQGRVFATAEDLRLQAEETRRMEFLQTASRVISEGIADIAGAELADIRRSRPDGRVDVTAMVRAPVPITPDQVAKMQSALRSELDEEIELTIRTMLSLDTTADRYLNEELAEIEPERAALLSSARAVLDSWLARHADQTQLLDVELDMAAEPSLLIAHLMTVQPLATEQLEEMRQELLRELPREVQLRVRFTIGGEVSLSGDTVAEP